MSGKIVGKTKKLGQKITYVPKWFLVINNFWAMFFLEIAYIMPFFMSPTSANKGPQRALQI